MLTMIVIAMAAAQPGATAAQPTIAAQADATATRPTLWENVRAGLSRAEVRTLHPAGPNVFHYDDMTTIENYEFAPQCTARVQILHAQGVVDRVRLRSRGSIGNPCPDAVLSVLSMRHGEAVGRRSNFIFFGAGINYIWHSGGVTLRFRKLPGGIYGNDPARLDWELTYSETAGGSARQ